MNVDAVDNCYKENYCSSTIDLQKYLKGNVDKILKNVSDDKFVQIYKSCYKEFVKKDDIDRPSFSGSSVEAKKYRTLFNDIVSKTLSETIDDTVSNMDSKFKELEQLIKEQSESSVIWRPPGNAAEHIIPFDFACQEEKKKELEEKIQREQEALKVLKERLHQRRKKVNAFREDLISTINGIKTVVAEKCD